MHKKRQPSNENRQHCTSRKQQPPNQAAVHASNQDNLYWLLPDIELLLYVLSFEFIFSAGWPYDLCRADTMMPICSISLKPRHRTCTTPHPAPPRHQAQIRQHGAHCGRNRTPCNAYTTEIKAPGQPPGARNHAHTRQRWCAGT